MFKKAAVVAAMASALVIGGAGAAHADSTVANIKAGSSNTTGVKCVQIALNDHYGAGLAVDGDFGKETTKWVKVLQAENQIDKDGIVGKVTGQLVWNELKAHNDKHNCFHHIPTTSSKA